MGCRIAATAAHSLLEVRLARSALNQALRDSRRERDLGRTLDERMARARELAIQGIRDYAATHQLTYGEARRRLRAAMRDGRTKVAVPGDE